MKIIPFLAALSGFLIAFSACAPVSDTNSANVQQASVQSNSSEKNPGPFARTVKGLDKYWYQGKGEISVYELEQNRYRDVHPGKAVLVFVTEDFLTEKQVKNERYQEKPSTKVLKLNALSKFTTGLYDYSIMSSVFTPVNTFDYPHTLKVTNSVQDWCGQVFAQVNWQEGHQYQETLHSYFESEADQVQTIPGAVLEDELMVRLRMSPDDMPTGQLNVIPSLTYLRLRHRPFAAYEAEATMADYTGDQFTSSDPLKVYTLNFPSEQRTVEVVFRATAPYVIEGWMDTYPSAFDRQKRSTIARRTETILEPYWSKNALSDTPMREALGL